MMANIHQPSSTDIDVISCISMPSGNASPSYELWKGIGQLSVASTSLTHVKRAAKALVHHHVFGFRRMVDCNTIQLTYGLLVLGTGPHDGNRLSIDERFGG